MKMNREALKKMGLTDEQIEDVMKAHGQSVNELKEQVSEVDTLNSQIDDYQKQIDERDKQLDELSKKAKGNEKLTSEINELKKQNKETKEEYEAKLNEQAFNHKLSDALKGASVRNVKAVEALLDLDIVKLEDGELKGLNEQMESLKESDPYLFKQEQQQEEHKPNFTTGQHNKNSGPLTRDQIMQETDATKRQKLIMQNSHLF